MCGDGCELLHHHFLAVVDVEATGGLGHAHALEGVPGIVGGGGMRGDILDGGGAVFHIEADAVAAAYQVGGQLQISLVGLQGAAFVLVEAHYAIFLGEDEVGARHIFTIECHGTRCCEFLVGGHTLEQVGVFALLYGLGGGDGSGIESIGQSRVIVGLNQNAHTGRHLIDLCEAYITITLIGSGDEGCEFVSHRGKVEV